MLTWHALQCFPAFVFVALSWIFVFFGVCKVEVWLNRVLDTMRSTVRHEMTEAVTTYEDKPREQWLFDYPAQVNRLRGWAWTFNWCCSLLGFFPLVLLANIRELGAINCVWDISDQSHTHSCLTHTVIARFCWVFWTARRRSRKWEQLWVSGLIELLSLAGNAAGSHFWCPVL